VNCYDVELTKTIVIAIEAETEEDAIRLAADSMDDDSDGTWSKAEPACTILATVNIPKELL
jgi:hypothetical protein